MIGQITTSGTAMKCNLDRLMISLALLVSVFGATRSQAGAQLSDAQIESLARSLTQRLVTFDEHGRLGPDFDRADTLDQFRKSMREGMTQDEVNDWLNRETESSFFSFAGVGASHDPKAVYRLPFDTTEPRRFLRGPGSRGRRGSIPNSYEFAMPKGTPVLAAREGQVMRVVHGYTRGGNSPQYARGANAVYILHADGTFAAYRHLSPDGLIERGARVEAGAPIGYSGQTGDVPKPLLQFSVSTLIERTRPNSLRIQLVDDRGKKITPLVGRSYPGPPSTNAGNRFDELLKGEGMP